MAKKKRKEEPEVEVPDFDEVKFMKGEMRALRTTVLVVVWAIPAALASWALTIPPLSIAVVAFFAGIGMMFLLKWILPILKVDTSEWKRNAWMGHGSTFFFTWLAIWILLLNPPFADLSPPLIFGVTVGTTTFRCGDSHPVNGSTAIMNVSVGDNVAVTSVTAGSVSLTPIGGSVWSGRVPDGQITIVAKDANGNTAACPIAIS